MKTKYLLLGLFILATSVVSCHTASPPEKAQAKPGADARSAQSPTVVFPDGFSVQVRLALTPEEQARGLMFVKDLPPDRGMLFLFKTDEQRAFWMKNCFIPLDLIWLDKDFQVVDITHDAPPCQSDPCPNYYPNRAIRNVLEVLGGTADAHHLQIGQRLVVVGLPGSP